MVHQDESHYMVELEKEIAERKDSESSSSASSITEPSKPIEFQEHYPGQVSEVPNEENKTIFGF